MDLIFDTLPFYLDKDCRYPYIPNNYLESLTTRRSANTVRRYAYELKSYLDWCEENEVSWDGITMPELWAFARQIPGSNTTFNGVMFRVREFYRFAALHHGVENPIEFFGSSADKWKRRGGKLPRIDLVSLVQYKKFLKGFTHPRDLLLAKVFYLTGLRLSELITLPRSFLDLKPTANRIEYQITGKGEVVRTLTMGWGLRCLIADYAKGTTGPFIFTDDGIHPLHPDTVQKAFRKNSARTAVKIHPHLLRHLFATVRLRALEQSLKVKGELNSALKVLQYELGHRNITTTSIYLHVASTEEASKTLADFQEKGLAQIDP